MIIIDMTGGLDMSIQEELIDIRRKIHMYPEIAFDTKRTDELITGYLKKLGITILEEVSYPGVVGIIKGRSEERVIAIRADTDALPIREENDVSCRSRIDGAMHGCGHDIHIACLLGAAKILSESREELPGSVKLVFQPAEEVLSGAARLIEKGVMEHPHVDAFIGAHVWPDLKSGTILVNKGSAFCAVNNFNITVKGRGAHGAMPHKAVDPIFIGNRIADSLYALTGRKTDALDTAVLSICSFNSGSRNNIIPDDAVLKGTIRAEDIETINSISLLVKDISEKTASAFGAVADVEFIEFTPPVINDIDMAQAMIITGGKVLGSGNVFAGDKPSVVSEDFALYSNMVPSVFFRLGCGFKDKKTNAPLHSSVFMPDESCIIHGASVFARFAYDYLKGAIH